MSDWKKLYFIGVGGIGMSALARYFNDKGVEVYGYDKTKTVLTKKLEDEGIWIHYEDDIAQIPTGIDVVIYTPAIPSNHKGLQWLRDQQYPILKRSELLGRLSVKAHTIAVAGTHGKTTTSSLISHILTDSDIRPNAILGGIPTAVGTNYIKGESNWLVTEADEFDRSFLQLYPSMAIVMSVDPDHLDIYKDFESMKEAFADFCGQIKSNGILIIHSDALVQLDSTLINVLQQKNVKCISFGSKEADVQIMNVRVENARQYFDLKYEGEMLKNFSLRMAGSHNIENATAAIIVALRLGLTPEALARSVFNFEGIARRFEWILETEDVVMIDDYAHHPTELRRTIDAARDLYPGKHISAVFQPHLFSRTQDFMEEFAEVLSTVDELILLPIYPARELPIDGVESSVLLEKIKLKNKYLLNKIELLDHFKNNKPEILLMLGAGDIGAEVSKVKEILH